jgi:hypothetical protein
MPREGAWRWLANSNSHQAKVTTLVFPNSHLTVLH